MKMKNKLVYVIFIYILYIIFHIIVILIEIQEKNLPRNIK